MVGPGGNTGFAKFDTSAERMPAHRARPAADPPRARWREVLPWILRRRSRRAARPPIPGFLRVMLLADLYALPGLVVAAMLVSPLRSGQALLALGGVAIFLDSSCRDGQPAAWRLRSLVALVILAITTYEVVLALEGAGRLSPFGAAMGVFSFPMIVACEHALWRRRLARGRPPPTQPAT